MAILPQPRGGILKGIRRFFLFFLSVFVIFPLFLGGLVLLLLLYWPSALLNNRTLAFAWSHGWGLTDLQWKKAQLKVTSYSPLKKRVILELKQPCWTREFESSILAPLRTSSQPSPRVQGVQVCFENALADFDFQIGPRRRFWITLGEIRTLHLLGGEWLWQGYDGRNKENRIRGKLQLLSPPEQAAPRTRSWSLEAHAQFESSQKRSTPSLRLVARIQNLRRLFHEPLRGTLSLSSIRWIPYFERLSLRGCNFEADFSRSHPELSLDCAIRGAPNLKQNGTTPPTWLLKALHTSDAEPVRGQAQTRIRIYSTEIEGSLKLKVEPLLTSVTEWEGRLTTDFSGRLDRSLVNWTWRGELSAQMRIAPFQKLVALLNDTNWAVPAPFRALQGEVQLRILKQGLLWAPDRPPDFPDLPFRLQTRLASADQRLQSDSTGFLIFGRRKPQRSPYLQLRLALNDVALELPRLKFQGLPQILPDSRIARLGDRGQQAGSAARATPPPRVPLLYDVYLDTPTNHPVRLISNLAKNPIPLHVHLFLHPEKIAGQLRTDGFALELFRRNATLETLELGFLPPSASVAEAGVGIPLEMQHPLNAAIRVQYTDYTVRILLEGTLEKPQVTLTSTPPLSREQILSVLLFGEPLERLNSDQTASLGNFSLAVANRAIGFLSLYLLASTPIQSVGYDPRTGVFTAKLRISEGTSITIGAEPGALQLIELQKRLGGFWTIVTEFNDPTLPERRSIQAFLEWSHRY